MESFFQRCLAKRKLRRPQNLPPIFTFKLDQDLSHQSSLAAQPEEWKNRFSPSGRALDTLTFTDTLRLPVRTEFPVLGFIERVLRQHLN